MEIMVLLANKKDQLQTNGLNALNFSVRVAITFATLGDLVFGGYK